MRFYFYFIASVVVCLTSIVFFVLLQCFSVRWCFLKLQCIWPVRATLGKDLSHYICMCPSTFAAKCKKIESKMWVGGGSFVLLLFLGENHRKFSTTFWPCMRTQHCRVVGFQNTLEWTHNSLFFCFKIFTYCCSFSPLDLCSLSPAKRNKTTEGKRRGNDGQKKL